MKIKCKCGKLATWCLMSYPGDKFETIDKTTGKTIFVKSEDYGITPYACDDCVPKGCSCWEWNNKDFNSEIYEEPEGIEGKDWEWIIEDISWRELDGEGKQIPCCEWWYDKEGWDNEK